MKARASEEEEDGERAPLERYIQSLVGLKGLLVFKVLIEANGDVTEEVIVKSVGYNKNVVRRLLYKLQDLNLVVYKRVRNRDTGWYSYYWRANREGLTLALLELKKNILNKLREKYASMQSEASSYICTRCNREYSFDEAFDSEFKCPRCETELSFQDRTRKREVLETYIKRLEEELANEKQKLQLPSS